jgi:predicted DNA-binding transcriptional regulator YafY
LRIEPAPTPEEAAAIVAALEALREEETAEDTRSFSNRSRWRLAGLFGRGAASDEARGVFVVVFQLGRHGLGCSRRS